MVLSRDFASPGILLNVPWKGQAVMAKHLLSRKPSEAASDGDREDPSCEFRREYFSTHSLPPTVPHLMCVCVCACVLVSQSCPTLCDPMDCNPPGSSVHGILQARIQEYVAISFSRGSYWPKDWTQVSSIVGRFFTIWATREAFQPDYNPLPSAWFPSKASTRLDVGSLYSSFRLLLLLVYLLVLLSCFLHFL